MEVTLRDAVAECRPAAKRGRRKTQAVTPVDSAVGKPTSAASVLEMGIEKGWIN